MFRRHLTTHRRRLQKTPPEMISEDYGELHDEHRDYWCVLVDKGYYGLQNDIRVIIPQKIPPRGRLDAESERHNQKIAVDWSIVEMFLVGWKNYGTV